MVTVTSCEQPEGLVLTVKVWLPAARLVIVCELPELTAPELATDHPEHAFVIAVIVTEPFVHP